jgi:polar amino acid transport system substrate-binding protein
MTKLFKIPTNIVHLVFIVGIVLNPIEMVQAKKLALYTQDFKPFSYLKGNNVEGIGAELIRAACNHANLTCNMILYPWPRAQALVKDGISGDGLFVIGHNKPREEYLYFSTPLLLTQYAFFVHNKNADRIRELADLQTYAIGAYGPSNTLRSLEKLLVKSEAQDPKITFNIITYNNDVNLFQMLLSSRVMAVYSNRDVGNNIIKEYRFNNLKVSFPHKSLNYYVGFSKKTVSKDTVDKFNSSYEFLLENGSLKDLFEKYHLLLPKK